MHLSCATLGRSLYRSESAMCPLAARGRLRHFRGLRATRRPRAWGCTSVCGFGVPGDEASALLEPCRCLIQCQGAIVTEVVRRCICQRAYLWALFTQVHGTEQPVEKVAATPICASQRGSKRSKGMLSTLAEGPEGSMKEFFNRLGDSGKLAYGILRGSKPESHSGCGIRHWALKR